MTSSLNVRPDAKDVAGHTPLHFATSLMTTQWARDECSRLLVYGAGADVNAQNRFLCTPLHDAAHTQCPITITVLLRLGADVNVKALHGSTASMYAAPQHRRLMMKMCNFCNRAGAVQSCSKCKAVVYCDAKCQKKDWKARHKRLCGKDAERLGVRKATFGDADP